MYSALNFFQCRMLFPSIQLASHIVQGHISILELTNIISFIILIPISFSCRSVVIQRDDLSHWYNLRYKCCRIIILFVTSRGKSRRRWNCTQGNVVGICWSGVHAVLSIARFGTTAKDWQSEWHCQTIFVLCYMKQQESMELRRSRPDWNLPLHIIVKIESEVERLHATCTNSYFALATQGDLSCSVFIMIAIMPSMNFLMILWYFLCSYATFLLQQRTQAGCLRCKKQPQGAQKIFQFSALHADYKPDR